MRGRVKKHTISLKTALAGLGWALKTQPNFQVHALATGAVAVLAIVLRVPMAEVPLLVLAIALVLVAELFNTALEAATDQVAGGEYQELIKVAKDVSAAAVLTAALAAVVIAALVLIQ